LIVSEKCKHLFGTEGSAHQFFSFLNLTYYPGSITLQNTVSDANLLLGGGAAAKHLTDNLPGRRLVMRGVAAAEIARADAAVVHIHELHPEEIGAQSVASLASKDTQKV
jgi:hypothetical protein